MSLVWHALNVQMGKNIIKHREFATLHNLKLFQTYHMVFRLITLLTKQKLSKNIKKQSKQVFKYVLLRHHFSMVQHVLNVKPPFNISIWIVKNAKIVQQVKNMI